MRLCFKSLLIIYHYSIQLTLYLLLYITILRIKTAIKHHFTEYFKTKSLETIPSSSEFFSLYEPHPEFEIHYQNLTHKISKQEWQNLIPNLPNQKAAGPLETCYEHIKFASSKAQNIF